MNDPTPAGQVAITAPTPAGRPDPTAVSVMLLQTSWVLAEAAHDLPTGRLSGKQVDELADTLQALGYVLRFCAPDGEGA